MTLNKATHYGLCAAVEMARAAGAAVTVGDVAARYGIPESALAKVFQQLVRAGLAFGTRGIGGGYRLAKAPSQITVLEVISVFEPSRSLALGMPAPSASPEADAAAAPLRELFDEVEETVRCTFASVNLETLVGRETAREAAGVRARGTGPAPPVSDHRP